MKLKVHILGNGNAAGKHRKAFAELSDLYDVIDDYLAADLVDICAPSHVHFVETWDALRHVKFVFCEKPVAASLREVSFLEKVGLSPRICPISQHRFTHPEKFKLSRAYKKINKRDTDYYTKSKWRGKWETELGGVLTTQGYHLLDLFARDHRFDTVECTITADQEYQTEVETSARVWLRTEHFLNIADLTRIDFENHWEASTIPQGYIGDVHEGLVNQFRLAHKAFTTGGPLPVTLKDARKSIELLTACYYSAYTGKPVKLPILPGHPFYNGWQTAMKQWSQRHLQHTESSQQIPA